MNKKTIPIIIIIVIGLVLLAGLIRTNGPMGDLTVARVNGTSNETKKEGGSAAVVISPSTSTAALPVLQATTTSEASSQKTRYEIPVLSEMTVLGAMRVYSSTGNFTFGGEEYPSLGYFVESIGGKENANGFYWFLYIDGKSSDTGASQTIVRPSNTVEWRYEKSY